MERCKARLVVKVVSIDVTNLVLSIGIVWVGSKTDWYRFGTKNVQKIVIFGPIWVSLIKGVAGNRTRVTAILAVGATATLSLRTTGGCFRGKGWGKGQCEMVRWRYKKTRGGTMGNPLVSLEMLSCWTFQHDTEDHGNTISRNYGLNRRHKYNYRL